MSSGWTRTTLGEVAAVNPKMGSLSEDAPFVPMDAVHAGKRFVAYYESRGERSGARAFGGDVLFARITPCLENGKVAQLPYGAGPCGGSTEFIVIRGSELICSDFIYFWASSEETRNTAAGLMTGTTGRQRLSWQDLSSIELDLPPIEEQRRIVDLVSSVDTFIDALQQQADVARDARNAVLHELLSAGGDDWRKVTLGEVAIVNPRVGALSEDSPFVPMDAVHVGKRFVAYFEPRGKRAGARGLGGDVLFARITPCLENGKVAQLPHEVGPCGGSTEFIIIRGSESMTSDFAYFWASSELTRNTAARLMIGTTGRQRLSWQSLSEIGLKLPPIEHQKRIVEIVSSMDEVIQSTEQAVSDAKSLRSSLLSGLLSGEHEIPESYDRLLGAA